MIDVKPACAGMIDLLTRVTADDLDHPTPCSAYTVADLIDHIDGSAQGLAFTHVDAAGQAPAVREGDWRDGVAKHVWTLGEAWDDAAAWQGSSTAGGLDLPNEVWGRIALTEMVVHGWDLAAATGTPFDLPEATLQACYDHVSGFVADAPVAGLWGPPVDVPADAPLLDRIVAATGRDPSFTPGR